MNREELEKAMARTCEDILELKQQLDDTDPEEYRKISTKLRELRYLQLWHISQLEFAIEHE